MPESSDLDVEHGATTVTTGGVRVHLATGDRATVAMLSVTVKAYTTNAGKVYVGGEGVTTANGFDLDPGDSITFTTDSTRKAINLSKIWLDADNDGDNVRWIALRD